MGTVSRGRALTGAADDTTEVYVMAEDKLPENYASDNDDGSFIKDEEQQHDLQRTKPATTHCLVHTPTTAPTNGHGLHGGSAPYMGDLPVRGTPFHPPMIQTEMAPQQHSFVESGGMPVSEQSAVSAGSGPLGLDLVASPHDTSRRPSVFSEYASPGSGSMYSQQWQQTSAGPNAPSMYAYTAQQAPSQQPAFVGQTVQISPGQPFMASSFEGSPRTEYDTNGNALFRAADLPHAPVGQQQGYYVPGDGRSNLRVMTQVVEGVSRNSVQQ